MAKEKQAVNIVGGFTKEQFLQSRQWEGTDKDILSAFLEDGKSYTVADAKKLIDEFKKGKVK